MSEPLTPTPPNLEACHATFRRWFGADFDTDALDAVLATAAVEQLDGDPVWLLVVSGSGNAKTEIVSSLAGIDAHLISTISSEGALLSATSAKEVTASATGGLLQKIGPRGVVVIKDVTSILSMSGDRRSTVIAALREVYDGEWTRNVGTDGGRSLTWKGRIAVLGAVTTEWDRAHAVIASMGDRFVLVRMDSSTGRLAAGRQAMSNIGHEEELRRDLRRAVKTLMENLNLQPGAMGPAEEDRLLAAADLVTRARTPIERDYRGDVIHAHAPEAPTRFLKQLAQIFRGGLALGMERDHALRLAMRCASDSLPPTRQKVINDIKRNPGAATSEIWRRLGLSRAAVDRELQALQMLGVLTVSESGSVKAPIARYALSENVDTRALQQEAAVPDLATQIPPASPAVPDSAARVPENPAVPESAARVPENPAVPESAAPLYDIAAEGIETRASAGIPTLRTPQSSFGGRVLEAKSGTEVSQLCAGSPCRSCQYGFITEHNAQRGVAQCLDCLKRMTIGQ